MSEKKLNGPILQGVVVSAKMVNTVVVAVTRRITHPLYEKIITKTTKLHAHAVDGQCKEGDTVLIQECRPISKTKSWMVVETVGAKA